MNMLLTILLSLSMMLGFFLILFGAVAFIQDKRLFNSAPKDIQKAILPHAERFRGAHMLGWFILVLGVILMMGSLTFGVVDAKYRSFDYLHMSSRLLVMLLSTEAFDILFFDYFLLNHSHFYQHYFPETEGLDGYHDFGFNFRSHLFTSLLLIVISFAVSFVSFI